jgi:hypothetical protein
LVDLNVVCFFEASSGRHFFILIYMDFKMSPRRGLGDFYDYTFYQNVATTWLNLTPMRKIEISQKHFVTSKIKSLNILAPACRQRQVAHLYSKPLRNEANIKND